MTQLLYGQTRDLVASIVAEEPVVKYLSLLQAHHKDTYHHSLRVGELSLDLGLGTGLQDEKLKVLGYGALLHDIGKTKISLDILTKGEPLTNEEQLAIKGHPRLGFLEVGDFGYDDVRLIVVSHHEYKKEPYPRNGNDRRRNEAEERETAERRWQHQRVAALAQIVAVSDIYDALASQRAYKQAMNNREIAKTMTELYTGEKIYLDNLMRRFNANFL